MAINDGDAQFGWRFLTLARNSFLLAGVTAVIGVLLALLLAYGARWAKAGLAAAWRPCSIAWSGWAMPCPVR